MSSNFLNADALPQLLLVEPDSLVRSTVSGVCIQLGLAQVHQAASVAVAEQVLANQPCDLVLISLSEEEPAFRLLEQLRAGSYVSSSQIPVAATTRTAGADLVTKVRAVQVRRLLLQPYKIRDVVHTVESIAAEIERGVH